ncbi:hypothetical protein GUJ93_ZPchr0011g28634 [Zizania palustris]|uniref:Uncharacterized protein n=1 Tax=Zizania palustris TaxID=103762 RepID=A0A8J6BRW4_ZIZPA|nr:hypothetical protein GUJ93_ZPchr0011g28634 [Zizania palustris]
MGEAWFLARYAGDFCKDGGGGRTEGQRSQVGEAAMSSCFLGAGSCGKEIPPIRGGLERRMGREKVS